MVADAPLMNDDTAPAVTALTIAPNNIFFFSFLPYPKIESQIQMSPMPNIEPKMNGVYSMLFPSFLYRIDKYYLKVRQYVQPFHPFYFCMFLRQTGT